MIFKQLKKSAAVLGAAAGIALLSAATPSHAAIITLDPSDTGWYDASGNHSVSNDNYFVGNYSSTEHRNYFTFNLSGLSVPSGQVVTGLQLQLAPFSPSFSTGSITYNLYDYSSTAGSPENISTTSGLDKFNDLGSGTSYGTFTATPSSGSPYLINLNSAAVTAFNSSGSGYFTVGGALGSYSPTSSDYLFGTSYQYPGGQVLQITTEDSSVAPVPELSTMILVAIGMMGMMGYGWVQSKKKVGSKATFPSMMA